MTVKRINSKKKGDAFERKIYKALNDAFGVKYFKRTPLSGGWSQETGAADIMAPDWFGFSIECKHSKDDVIKIDGVTDKFRKWWRQAEKGAEKEDKAPCLIYKKNNQKILVTLYQVDFANMHQESSVYLDEFRIRSILSDKSKQFQILLFDDFLRMLKSVYANKIIKNI